MDLNSRICLLSYQRVHRKTIDTLASLKIYGYTNVCVYAKPLHYTKQYIPIVKHRPEIETSNFLNEFGYERIIRNIGYELRNISSYEEIEEEDSSIFLVCGAGIIPIDIIQRYRIINSHPGYLPVVRGLDALKWAVIEGLPIGVTTHLLGNNIDAGNIIERIKLPIYKNDTFHMVAYRQYSLEIQMLVHAIEKIDEIMFYTDGEGYPVYKRMPHKMETMIYPMFEKYKLHNLMKENSIGE